MQNLGLPPDCEFTGTMPAVTCIDRLVLMPKTMAKARIPRGKGTKRQGCKRADAMGQGCKRARGHEGRCNGARATGQSQGPMDKGPMGPRGQGSKGVRGQKAGAKGAKGKGKVKVKAAQTGVSILSTATNVNSQAR